jgi:diguanylate cyclase (GGDEF)-like protein
VIAAGALADATLAVPWAAGVGGGILVAGLVLLGFARSRSGTGPAAAAAWSLTVALGLALAALVTPILVWRGLLGLVLVLSAVWLLSRAEVAASGRLFALGTVLLGLAGIGLVVSTLMPTLGGGLVGVLAILVLGGAAALAAASVVGPVVQERTDLQNRLRQLEDDHQHLLRLTDSDPLTGCPTRDALRAWFDRWQGGQPVSIASIDVDNLKSINERYGHAAGDEALRLVAGVLSSSIRPGDLVVRWGGDEFVVVLRGAEHEAATRRLTSLMAGLEEAAAGFPYDLPLRVDWGVASCSSPADISSALAEADERMFAMKRRR